MYYSSGDLAGEGNSNPTKPNKGRKRFEASRIFSKLLRKVKFTTDYEIVHLIYVQKFDRIVCLLK